MKKVTNYFSDWTMFEKSWLITSSILMVILSVIWQDSIIALLSGLAGIISVVLCAKGKIENYAFGLFQAITYGYICFQSHIYGEVMYNILMVPLIIIGFFNWKKNMITEKGEVKARNLTQIGWIIVIIGSIIAVGGYSLLLKMLGGNFVLVDATSTTLSVIATLLMLARYSEQWIIWIIVNIASVILWIMALMEGGDGSITLLVMWTAYLFNSIYGYINWRKMAKQYK